MMTVPARDSDDSSAAHASSSAIAELELAEDDVLGAIGEAAGDRRDGSVTNSGPASGGSRSSSRRSILRRGGPGGEERPEASATGTSGRIRAGALELVLWIVRAARGAGLSAGVNSAS